MENYVHCTSPVQITPTTVLTIQERHLGWLKCVESDSTRALTSPNDVHHSVNLSNTKFISYIYTAAYLFFLKYM